MKSFRIALSITAFFLTLLILINPCSSFESTVLMTTEHNLSIDIGPEYLLGSRLAAQSDDGGLYQQIVINNSSDGNATNASLLVYSLPVYTEELAQINATTFSEFMESTMVGMIKLLGANLVGEEHLKNKTGENVTLYSFTEPESVLKPNGDEHNFAIWPIDSRNMIMLASSLDEATNKQIIETLAVESLRC